MNARKNIERASALFERRDEIVKRARDILESKEIFLGKVERLHHRHETAITQTLKVTQLLSEFKLLAVAEATAQIEEVQKELHSLSVVDEFDVEAALSIVSNEDVESHNDPFGIKAMMTSGQLST